MRRVTADRPVDPAVAKARAVVGLYGDPTVSWSIALDVSLTEPLDSHALLTRCMDLEVDHPHLGRRPTPLSFSSDSGAAMLEQLLDTPFGDHDPLVRVALAHDGRRLIVAAHHGVVDGLGLLAALSLIIGEPVASTARGIGDQEPAVSFVRSSFSRILEALFSPPTRLAVDGLSSDHSVRTRGDVTARGDLASARVNTSRSIAAAALALTEWNRRHGARSERLVAAVGASRRDGSGARPDRDTAYLRLRLPSSPTAGEVRRLLMATKPEPTFPERPPRLWTRLVTAVLHNRLGSSVLVSNLGLVKAPPALSTIAFYPAAAGHRGLAVGVASTASSTVVTVRMPRSSFSESAASDLCTLTVEQLRGIAV